MRNDRKLLGAARALEKELLSALISNGIVSVSEVCQIVSVENFNVFPKHFEAWLESRLTGAHLGVVFNQKNVNVSDVMGIISSRPVLKIAQDVRNVSKAIKLYEYLSKSSDGVTGDNVKGQIEELYQAVFKLGDSGEEQETQISPLMGEYEKQREEFKQKGDALIGIPSGFEKLDGVIDGIRKGHFWIVGGYTNLGKSSFSLNLALNLLKQGKRVVFYTLEMSASDIISRLLGIMTEQRGTDILKGKGSGAEKDAMEFLTTCDLNIVSDRRELDAIIFSMTEFDMKKKVDAFFVDYIQNIQVKTSDEYNSMRQVATDFQAAALKLQTPIIAVSQISNEAARSPNGAVMGFKGSGTIAAAADLAIELTNNEENIDTQREKIMAGNSISVRLLIKKNRHGPIGYIDLEFDGKTGRFFSLTDEFLK